MTSVRDIWAGVPRRQWVASLGIVLVACCTLIGGCVWLYDPASMPPWGVRCVEPPTLICRIREDEKLFRIKNVFVAAATRDNRIA